MAGLDDRMYVRMSSELKALIEQEARRLGIDQSEWMRAAALRFAIECGLFDQLDAQARDIDPRDLDTLARLLGE